MPLHEGELPLDLFGKEQVVGVQPGDPVAPGLLKPRFAVAVTPWFYWVKTRTRLSARA